MLPALALLFPLPAPGPLASGPPPAAASPSIGAVPDAGPDQVVAFPAAAALSGGLSGAAPLAWVTADGNGASEDMLVRYDDPGGQLAVGLLASGTQVYGWLGDLVQIGGALVGNSVLGRELVTVDPLTAACAHLSGPFDATWGDVHSLAYDPLADRLYAVDLVERQLLLLDYLNGVATPIGNRTLWAYPLVRALAWDAAGGRLLAIDQQTDALFAIDPATGAPSFLSTVAPFPDARQEELACVGGELYMNLGRLVGGVMDRAQLQRVDPSTGHTEDVGPELVSVSGHALHVESLPERPRWTQLAGPGTAGFSDPASLSTTVAFSAPGVYVLELAAVALDGSVTGTDTVTVTSTGYEPFCAGDGSGTPCPCGNTGGAGEGCANSTGLGGLLVQSGGASVALDDTVLEASQLPPSKPGLFIVGPFAKNGGLGVPFGDGLRCVQGPPLRRYPLANTGPAGVMTQGSVAGLAQGTIQAGGTWLFQAWHRDDATVCGNQTNLSNAIAVTFGP